LDGIERCIDDEIPFDVPESWAWARLGTVVYNHGQMTPQDDFCYIDIGSIDNQRQRLNEEDTVVIAARAPSRARKIVEQGDILYSTVRPYLHNMCIIDRDFSHIPIASTGFAVMACHEELNNHFLFYYLLAPDFDSYANDAENAKGVAYPAINDTRLYNALIPLPPFAEQSRIVEKIKELEWISQRL
jgi:type I restriction enzyme S subunit